MAADASDLLARMFDIAPGAVVVAAADGRVLRLSEGARALLGFGASDNVAALRLVDIHHRADDVRVQRDLLARRGTNPVGTSESVEVSLRHRSGEVLPVRARVAVVRAADGRPVGTVHSFEDLREVRSLTSRTNELATQVEELEARITGQAILSRAAHELSQPLTAALGQIDMLLIEGGVADAAAERLERAAEQLERMRNLVHGLTRSANQQRQAGRG